MLCASLAPGVLFYNLIDMNVLFRFTNLEPVGEEHIFTRVIYSPLSPFWIFLNKSRFIAQCRQDNSDNVDVF